MLYASMAEYADYLQRLNASPKVSLMNSNMEMLRQLPGLNSSSLENSNVAGFTADSFLAYHYQHYPELLSAVLVQKNHSNASHPHLLSVAESFVQTVTSNQNVLPLNESRKAVGQSSSSCKNTSCITSTGSTKNNNKGSGRCKKRKSTEKETDQAEEIIHVRAKRGQATDSHSIAERVRREKINNKLRCLQEIVPGCNKSMGMAVMLEEIINYVHSLQNQVEFLSMELAAASCSYNLNMEAESYMQRTNSPEGLEMQKWSRERCREISSFCSTWSI